MTRTVGFVQRHAALGQRERLFVPVLQHHHVRLVAADGSEHVLGLHGGGKPLGVTKGDHRLVVPTELREGDARQRMHQGEVTTVARRVQRGGGLADVLAHDGDVADLPVALAELVMRAPDPARVVRGLRLLQGARVHGDGARLIAARGRQAAVQAPERGEPSRRHRIAEGVGRAAERARRLIQVVLQQRRLGEHRADGKLFVSRQRRAQRRGEHLHGCSALAALERGAGAHQQRLQRRRRHAASINLLGRSKRPPLRREPRVEAGGAVTLAAGPRLRPVQIAAAAARVRVLDLFEGEVRLPVLPLLGQRRGAVADLDPLHAAIVQLTRGVHVAKILVAGH
jgi:hypothetical protein